MIFISVVFYSSAEENASVIGTNLNYPDSVNDN